MARAVHEVNDGLPERQLYDELAYYTLAHGGPTFIHQDIVDAWASQHPSETSKTIRVAFALIGLYLHLEKGCSGRDVQRAHVQLAKNRKQWPAYEPPAELGALRVGDVVRIPPGVARDAAIDAWCGSVWEAWRDTHAAIAKLIRAEPGHWKP